MSKEHEEEELDFGLLPDVVWVSVMQYLTLSERNKVSQTCRLLNDIFHHPTLWRKVEIILSSTPGHPSDVHFINHDRLVQMIEMYGKYMKEVTLVYLSYEKLIPETCLKVINALKTECPFEDLIIDFETTLRIGRTQEVLPILELIRTAEHLQSLTLRSWPAYEYFDCDRLMTSITNNKNIGKLERLALFWDRPEDATWVSLNIKIPEPDQFLTLVNNLIYLQYLSLRSSMLSEEVVKTLARFSHAPLQRLGVLVTYEGVKADQHLPTISRGAWEALRNRSPDLRVDFMVVTRMPSIALGLFLQEPIPVGGIGFMRYADVRAEDLDHLTSKFSQTLEKFICYAQPENIDEELFILVQSCPNLKWFVYHGSINHRNVLNLVNSRESGWFHFDILDKNVITQDLPEEPEDGEDYHNVIRRSESGEYDFTRRNFIPEENEEERLQNLQDIETAVSKSIGYNWHLRDSHTLNRKIVGVRQNASGRVITNVVETTPTRYLIAKGWPWVRS